MIVDCLLKDIYQVNQNVILIIIYQIPASLKDETHYCQSLVMFYYLDMIYVMCHLLLLFAHRAQILIRK